MIDLSKLTAKELTALYNEMSSGTIKRFESHSIGVERLSRLISQLGADEATVLTSMKAAGIETPEFCHEGGTEAVPLTQAMTVETAASSDTAECGKAPPLEVALSNAEAAEGEVATSAPAEASRIVEEEPLVDGNAVENSNAESPAGFNDTDHRVLDLLRDLGPSKVGALREKWKAEDDNFRRLAPTQQKGIMRRSVRKLEAAGLVRKEGPVFSLPSA